MGERHSVVGEKIKNKTLKKITYDTNKFDEKILFNFNLRELQKDAKMLRDVNKLLNTFMSNTLYIEKNMEVQAMKFDKLHTKKWQRDIILKGWDFKHKIAIEGLKKLDIMFQQYGDESMVKLLNKKTIQNLDDEYWIQRKKFIEEGDE